MNSHSCRTNFSMITHLPTKNVSHAYRSTCLATLGLFVPKMNFIQYHTSIQWLLPPSHIWRTIAINKVQHCFEWGLGGGGGGGRKKVRESSLGYWGQLKMVHMLYSRILQSQNGRFRNLPLNLMDLSLKTLIKQPPFQTQNDQRLRVPQTFMINNY